MISSHKVTEIYFIIDAFFKEFDNLLRGYSLQDAKTGKIFPIPYPTTVLWSYNARSACLWRSSSRWCARASLSPYFRRIFVGTTPYPHRIHTVKLRSATSFCPCEDYSISIKGASDK